MSKYKVLVDFKDLKDSGKVYEKDDTFPSPANKKVTDARIKELSSTKNKRKQRLIEAVKVKEVKEQDYPLFFFYNKKEEIICQT